MTDYTVSSGVTSRGLVLGAGNELTILDGGKAIGTLVEAGGLEYVSSGGAALSETLSGGEYLLVGGSSASATIEAGGYLVVSAGAVVNAAIVDQAGALDVWGSAASASLNAGGTLDVFGGGKAAGTGVNEGGTQVIFAGAVAVATQIGFGGIDFVSSGGVASGSVVAAGGYEVLSTGGQASATRIDSGGTDDVYAGGTAIAASVAGGGAQLVFHGGKALDSVVASGGIAFVFSGGLESGTTVATGGWLVLLPGAAASASKISAGGQVISTGVVELNNQFSEIVFQGSKVSGGTIAAGGLQFVLPGGSADSVTLSGGAIQRVYVSGAASGVYLNSGGFQLVSSGGSVSGGIASGGTLYLYSGGVAAGVLLSAGGLALVGSSGAALGTILSSGGREYVFSGGTTSGTMVARGGAEYVYSTAVDSGSQISRGGAEFVYSGGVASNAVVSAGGLATVYSGAIAAGFQVRSGGILAVSAGGVARATQLRVDGMIDLAALAYSGTSIATLDRANDLLTVTEGANSAVLQLGGFYGSQSFGVAPDGAGGSLVSPYLTPCYCRGTRLLTGRGELAVEDIAIGDLLITLAGRERAVRWIGRRSYTDPVLAENPAVQPILIRAGALADRLPKRDLLISPQHALLLDGVLIPAAALVNGGSIVPAPAAGALHYYHLELESHDVIFAEGVAAETFLDDHNRSGFDNAGEYRLLYPDVRSGVPRYCAPRCDAGPRVEAVRARLVLRSEIRDVAVALPVTIPLSAGLVRVPVPAGVAQLLLTSPCGWAPGDLRRLGALVTGFTLGGEAFDLAGPGFGAGFHPPECHGSSSVRWTDGEAVVEIAPFPAERRCEITVAAVSAGNELPPGSITIEITGTGTTGAMLPAWAEELRLVSPHGWAPGDLRCLGALVMGLSVGGKTVDLTDACFAEGFHPAEWVEARTARWTDGDAVVMVAPAPVERWCEVEIAAVCGSSDAAAKAA